MHSLMLLAVCALFSAVNAGTEIDIVNQTGKPLNISHFTQNYTLIDEDTESFPEVIEPGKKAIIHFTVESTMLSEVLREIYEGKRERDGVYLTMDGETFAIAWCDDDRNAPPSLVYNPKVYANKLAHITITGKKIKSKKSNTIFVFTINDMPLDLGDDERY